MCAASESKAAPGGLQEHTGPEETGGPPVAGCRASSKGWNEKGDTRPLSFLTKNTFKYQNYTTLHLYSYASSKPLEQITQLQHEETLLGCGDHLKHHLLHRFVAWLPTCILHFRLQWLHIFLHSGTTQWAGSILDLLNKLKM